MKELQIKTEHDKVEVSLYGDKLYLSIDESYGDTAYCFLTPQNVQELKQFLNENFPNVPIQERPARQES